MNAITPIDAGPSADPSGERMETLAARLEAERAAMEARHLEQLEALGRIGMALAEAVGRRVAEVARDEAGDDAGGDAGSGAALGELGLSFNRITRAVRLTMTLETHVRDARRARLLGLETERAAEAARVALAETRRVGARELFIGRLVEDTVKLRIVSRDGHDPSAMEDDEIEYDEKDEAEIDDFLCASTRLLTGDKAYAGFADRPVSAVVAQICADLGLTPDWSLWAKEDWAIEEAQTVAGSPFSKSVSLGGDGFEADDPERQRFTPTPSPSPQEGGESTGPP